MLGGGGGGGVGGGGELADDKNMLNFPAFKMLRIIARLLGWKKAVSLVNSMKICTVATEFVMTLLVMYCVVIKLIMT